MPYEYHRQHAKPSQAEQKYRNEEYVQRRVG